MGKKKASSSAAAAALLPDHMQNKVFTSFEELAASVANQASIEDQDVSPHGTNHGGGASPSTSEKEVAMLNLLKKATKKDVVTREKALLDLRLELEGLLTETEGSTGSAMDVSSVDGKATIQAFSFQARKFMLEDESSRVRENACGIVSALVKAFPKKVQGAFKTLGPLWIISTSDPVADVRKSAKQGLVMNLSRGNAMQKFLGLVKLDLIHVIQEEMQGFVHSDDSHRKGNVNLLCQMLESVNAYHALGNNTQEVSEGPSLSSSSTTIEHASPSLSELLVDEKTSLGALIKVVGKTKGKHYDIRCLRLVLQAYTGIISHAITKSKDIPGDPFPVLDAAMQIVLFCWKQNYSENVLQIFDLFLTTIQARKLVLQSQNAADESKILKDEEMVQLDPLFSNMISSAKKSFTKGTLFSEEIEFFNYLLPICALAPIQSKQTSVMIKSLLDQLSLLISSVDKNKHTCFWSSDASQQVWVEIWSYLTSDRGWEALLAASPSPITFIEDGYLRDKAALYVELYFNCSHALTSHRKRVIKDDTLDICGKNLALVAKPWLKSTEPQYILDQIERRVMAVLELETEGKEHIEELCQRLTVFLKAAENPSLVASKLVHAVVIWMKKNNSQPHSRSQHHKVSQGALMRLTHVLLTYFGPETQLTPDGRVDLEYLMETSEKLLHKDHHDDSSLMTYGARVYEMLLWILKRSEFSEIFVSKLASSSPEWAACLISATSERYRSLNADEEIVDEPDITSTPSALKQQAWMPFKGSVLTPGIVRNIGQGKDDLFYACFASKVRGKSPMIAFDAQDEQSIFQAVKVSIESRSDAEILELAEFALKVECTCVSRPEIYRFVSDIMVTVAIRFPEKFKPMLELYCEQVMHAHDEEQLLDVFKSYLFGKLEVLNEEIKEQQRSRSNIRSRPEHKQDVMKLSDGNEEQGRDSYEDNKTAMKSLARAAVTFIDTVFAESEVDSSVKKQWRKRANALVSSAQEDMLHIFLCEFVEIITPARLFALNLSDDGPEDIASLALESIAYLELVESLPCMIPLVEHSKPELKELLLQECFRHLVSLFKEEQQASAFKRVLIRLFAQYPNEALGGFSQFMPLNTGVDISVQHLFQHRMDFHVACIIIDSIKAVRTHNLDFGSTVEFTRDSTWMPMSNEQEAKMVPNPKGRRIPMDRFWPDLQTFCFQTARSLCHRKETTYDFMLYECCTILGMMYSQFGKTSLKVPRRDIQSKMIEIFNHTDLSKLSGSSVHASLLRCALFQLVYAFIPGFSTNPVSLDFLKLVKLIWVAVDLAVVKDVTFHAELGPVLAIARYTLRKLEKGEQHEYENGVSPEAVEKFKAILEAWNIDELKHALRKICLQYFPILAKDFVEARERKLDLLSPSGSIFFNRFCLWEGVFSISSLIHYVFMDTEVSLPAFLLSKGVSYESIWHDMSPPLAYSEIEISETAYKMLLSTGFFTGASQNPEFMAVLDDDDDEVVAGLLPEWLGQQLTCTQEIRAEIDDMIHIEDESEEEEELLGDRTFTDLIICKESMSPGYAPSKFIKNSVLVSHECLKYFRVWNILLDILAQERSSEGNVHPFRRVFTAYLRTHFHVFHEYQDLCAKISLHRESLIPLQLGLEYLEADLKSYTYSTDLLRTYSAGIAMRSSDPMTYKLSSELGYEGVHMSCESISSCAMRSFILSLRNLPALSRRWFNETKARGTVHLLDSFMRKKLSPYFISLDIELVKDMRTSADLLTSVAPAGIAAAAAATTSSSGDERNGALNIRASLAGKQVNATYTFNDVALEITLTVPELYPLQPVQVEFVSQKTGMSESKWRKTLLGMTKLLSLTDNGCLLLDSVMYWKSNLDQHFRGMDECPICYSILHYSTSTVPSMKCKTCKHKFHKACLCKWFHTSNSSTCPLCRSEFSSS